MVSETTSRTVSVGGVDVPYDSMIVITGAKGPVQVGSIEKLMMTLKGLKAEVAGAGDRNKDNEAHIKRLEDQVAKAEEARKAAQRAWSQMTANEAKLHQQIHRLNEDLAAAKANEGEVAHVLPSDLKDRIAVLEMANGKLEAEARKDAARIAELNGVIDDLSRDLNKERKLKAEDPSYSIAELLERTKAAESLYEETEKRRESCQIANAFLRTKIAELEEANATLTEFANTYRLTEESLRVELNKAIAARNKAEEAHNDLVAEFNDLRNELAEANTNHDMAHGETIKLRRELANPSSSPASPVTHDRLSNAEQMLITLQVQMIAFVDKLDPTGLIGLRRIFEAR